MTVLDLGARLRTRFPQLDLGRARARVPALARSTGWTWRSLLPLTATGWVVLVVGAVSYLAGRRLGWVELTVVAAGCLIALLLAVPFVVGRLRLQVERLLRPDRVQVGEPAIAELTITNDTPRGIGARIVEDHIDERPMRIEVPALATGKHTQAVYNLPTTRRGRYEVGPAIIAKADPLGLLRRQVTQTLASTLWVHPLYRPVQALPVGFAKDLEGPTTDTSPAGDVSFHTLREYQPGDDYRHIHWLSTARTGTTMIRHYVDNRRPNLAVLLDDRSGVYPDVDTFELAVGVAASLGVSSLLHRQPVALSFGAEPLIPRARSDGNRDSLLDHLTQVTTREGTRLDDAAAQVLRLEPGTSALAIVTGDVPTEELLATVRAVRRSCKVIVTRAWSHEARGTEALPGATLFDIDSLEGFAVAWERLVR